MAIVVNDRDVLLQAAAVRVEPIPIPIERVDGLQDALNKAGKQLRIKADRDAFFGTASITTPVTITLTAEKLGGLEGTVTWTISHGSATIAPSGDTCVITGSTVVGYSVGIKASVTQDSKVYEANYIVSKFGNLSQSDTVDLTTQVTGQLSNGKVSGLGALALLNQVDLNTQTVGALNGLTQVNNLGSLAYANAIAANQIGAGTLAAGVVYAGTVNAEKINGGDFTGKTFTGGTFSGSTFRTQNSGTYVAIGPSIGYDVIGIYQSSSPRVRLSSGESLFTGGTDNGAVVITRDNIPNGCHIELKPLNRAKPNNIIPGGISYSPTHGFIFCDSTGWYKPSAWTAV